VLGALLMREIITRYGRDNLGFLWLFVEPMIFTLGVAALWTAIGMHHGSSLPIVAFAITGYSSVLLWRNCVSRCSMAIQPNLNLLYHRNVRVLDIFLTRILLEISGATISFSILSMIFIWSGWMSAPVDMLKVLMGLGMLAWFGCALALVVGAGTAYSETVEKLWHPASYLLFPMSGAAFMVDWLPTPMQQTVMLLPMVHGVELLRDGYFGNAARTHYDIGYMSLACMTLTICGLLLARGASRRVVAP
jgi:capsular polysaccharide transport system permease protein